MPLSAEQKARLRVLTGADESATDDDLMTNALTELEAQKSDLTTAAEQVATLSREKMELSRRPAPGTTDEFPPAIAAGCVNNLSREIELMAREGSITGEQATAAKSLLGTPDKPNVLALSRTGANHPADGWLKVLALGKSGVNAKGEQQSGIQELSRQTHDHSAVTSPSGKVDDAKAMTDGQQEGEAWRKSMLAARGLSL